MELKHRMASSASVAAVLLLAGLAWAQKSPAPRLATIVLAPVDVYRNTTQHELAECADAFRSALRSSYRNVWLARTPSDYQACILRAQAEANARLAAAARTVRKADAQRALVAYHAAFLAAIGGIVPYPQEPVDGYEQRQSVLLHIMSHAWSRYELVE
jgi:heme A synthase